MGSEKAAAFGLEEVEVEPAGEIVVVAELVAVVAPVAELVAEEIVGPLTILAYFYKHCSLYECITLVFTAICAWQYRQPVARSSYSTQLCHFP